MIRVICPACRSKLDAKDELLGQTRNCPKCGGPVVIEAPPLEPVGAETAETSSVLSPPETSGGLSLARPDVPEHLGRLNRYLICDRQRIIATWENDGQGWMILAEHGFGPVFRNQEKIPNQGNFKLIELKLAMESDGLRLHGLKVYQLNPRWALMNLLRGDDAILKTVVGPGCLTREPKHAVRKYLNERFMRDVWQDAREVVDYLSNGDYHSAGPG